MNPIDIVDAAWLQTHLRDPDLVVLDGSYHLAAAKRDAGAEYLAAHIPGAIRFDIDAVKDHGNPLPHMLPDPESFATAAGAMGISNATRIVVYDTVGLYSAPRVAWTFRLFGAERVAILDGGWPAWLSAGGAQESGPVAAQPPQVFVPRFDLSGIADLEAVRGALGDGSAQVLDARSLARFSGDEPDPRPGIAAGHMPGALNLHYADVLDGGRFADAATIHAALKRAGLREGAPVVTTCGSGVTACILGVAMEKAGWPAPAIYDGSWSEWGSRADTAKATGSAGG